MPSKDQTATPEVNPIKAEIDEIKRRRILDEAVRQFFERGYEATSLESIAEGLGVTKQFIYSRFRNKAELLVHVCKAGATAADETVAFSATLDGAPAKRLAQIIRFFVRLQIEHRRERPAAALFMCSPPDAEGHCSFGAETGFIAALWREIPVRIAHINPAMPRTPGDPGIPLSAITACYEQDQPLRTMAGGSDAVSEVIAAAIAPLIPDGATLQTGLGKIPDAVLRALSGHRNLRLHSGLIGDGALALVRSGAMAPGRSALAGVAIGSPELYAGLDNEHFQFQPVTVTHDPATLAGIDRLVTINSAMEVDLYGQVHAEASSRGFLSGPGGASDYARGARASRGGLRVIALPSVAGGSSRIVPAGRGHGPVSLSRFDVDLVVTEHGIADLRELGHEARAQALIAIAAPDHREALARSWRDSMNALQEN